MLKRIIGFEKSLVKAGEISFLRLKLPPDYD
jgi:hypothetical protein